jgi:hypothetical protein
MTVYRHSFLCFFLFISSSLFAQQPGDWRKLSVPDRFGDATGEYSIVQAVVGSGTNSSGRKSSQAVGIYRFPSDNAVVIGLITLDDFGLPLDMIVLGNPPATLYIKDSSGKTHTFSGFEIENKGTLGVAFINDRALISLLKKNGTYKAVLEGDDRGWSCSFTFNGGMPE